jgi:hypothetical protein
MYVRTTKEYFLVEGSRPWDDIDKHAISELTGTTGIHYLTEESTDIN